MSNENNPKDGKKAKYRRGTMWTLDPEIYIRKATEKLQEKMGVDRTGVIDRAVLALAKWADEHPEEAKKLGEQYHLEKAKRKVKKKAK